MALAADRRIKILERVAEGMSIQVVELAREFGCSEMTIRRDIERLERDGFLRRTYGGATAHLTRSIDAFNARALAHAREKRLIAMAAVDLVGSARTIFIGVGTTAEQFARHLPVRPNLTVVTGSLPIASLLGTRANRVVALGGEVRHNELSCIGPIARASLERYRFEMAVIGTAGVSAGAGVTDLTDEEAELHRVASERSSRLVVLADGSKLGVVEAAVVVPVERVDALVTDPSAPQGELEALRAREVRLIVARGAGRTTGPPAPPAPSRT